MINLSVPVLWTRRCDRKVIAHLILYGPKKVQITKSPRGESGRSFPDSHYFCKLADSEFVPSRWLMYSETTDCVLCFC
jgi:hypothetical protein